MEDNWNYDLSKAPQGREIQIKTGSNKDGTPKYKKHFVEERIMTLGEDYEVRPSFYHPQSKCWSMYAEKHPPIAWQPYPAAPERPAQ